MNYKLKEIETVAISIGAIPLLFNLKIDYREIVNEDCCLFGERYILPLDKAREGSLSFCNMDNPVDAVFNSKASVVIVDYRHFFEFKRREDQCLIFVENVKLAFVKLLRKLTYMVKPTYLTDSTENKTNFIGPNVTIEDGAEIGDNVNIVGNVYIYDGVKIGNNVTIKPGTVIGGQGFGHVLDGDKYLLFPQIGGVVIEDDVRIGANTCIDKGTLGDTVLKSGCRIDNLVHIAHNVVIGENCLVVANSMVAGSVVVGNGTHIAPSTSILQGIKMGSGAYTGMGSCVIKDVEDNMLVYGVPAKNKGMVKKEMLEE